MDPDSYQSEKQGHDPYQNGLDPQHCFLLYCIACRYRLSAHLTGLFTPEAFFICPRWHVHEQINVIQNFTWHIHYKHIPVSGHAQVQCGSRYSVLPSCKKDGVPSIPAHFPIEARKFNTVYILWEASLPVIVTLRLYIPLVCSWDFCIWWQGHSNFSPCLLDNLCPG